MKFQPSRRPCWMAFWMGATITLAIAAMSFAAPAEYFKRVSTFLVCEQIDANCNTDEETSAETLWYFTEGEKTCLAYTDSPQEQIGFVDITDPSKPIPNGTVDMSGEPTTVRVIGDYAVVGVNTSLDYVNVSGKLSVVDLASKKIVYELDLPGQPDAVDVSKDTSQYPIYVAVAIENQRDEDLGDGAPPQLPAGMLTIITISSQAALADPSLWTSKDVPLTGLGDACRFPEDPEPEYVAIHPDNTKVVVTLQENNCNVLVDLATGAIIGAYDAGSVALQCIDLTEDDLVSQTEDTDVEGIFREPDGVTWIGETSFFATANEGDLDGGSRGFSIFNALDGNVIYDSGNTMELEVARIGHYPENRSENKGNEPENVLYAEANGRKFLFVASERSNLVFVYEVSDPTTPLLTQTLPVGTGPEGLAFVPDKNLLVVASEVDDRGDGIRSSISIFEIMRSDGPEYPTLVSVPRDGADEENGPFIPFSSLSGLSASNTDSNILYAVEDDSYTKNRVFTIDTSNLPSVITKEDRIFDGVGVLSACIDGKTGSTPLSDIINDDMTVNIDPEGIAVSADGGFWVVSEGIFKKNGDVKVPNFLLKLTQEACISECILLDDSFPTATEDGFVGVAEDGDEVVIAIQQAWDNEPNPRIAVYNTTSKTWKHAFYPLEVPASLNGGWVGLSDIASTGDGKFLVLERDNQSSADAKIKRISSIDLGDYSFADGVTLEKELYTDLIPHLSSTNGQIAEKVDGLAITSKGEVWISTNVGVGEQLLANVTPFKKNSKKAKKTKVKNSKKTKVKKTKEKKTAK